MHFFIFPLGIILWYLAYKSKPISNDEATSNWEEENFDKRVKLMNILKESF